jgi:hypothetical protein
MQRELMKSILSAIKIASRRLNNDLPFVLLLVVFCGFISSVVNPIGDFPLNDDWAFGWTVKNFLETGRYLPSDWDAPNLISQVIFGAVFCIPFGFSFTALRLSTLILGLIGILVTYALLREVKASPTMSFFGAIVVALNPLYFSLSNTFMTDVPSFTFAMLSVYFLVRALGRHSQFDISIGVIFSLVAILNRQSNLIILPAFSLAYLSKNGLKTRTIIEAIAPTIIGIFVYMSYSQWLRLTGRAPALYGSQIEQIIASINSGSRYVTVLYITNIFITSIYLGLFLCPFVIMEFARRYESLAVRRKEVWHCAAFVIVVTLLVDKYKPMPLVGNVLGILGMGPKGWLILTAVGIFGAVLLLKYLGDTISNLFGNRPDLSVEKGTKSVIVFIITLVVLYFLPIGALQQSSWYDRYLIIFIPLLMMLVVSVSRTKPRGNISFIVACISASLLLFYGGFTISATHDYLALNRARWQVFNELMQDGKVRPDQIYGGFEFNGWYFGNKLEICTPGFGKSARKTSPTTSDFKCFDDKRHYQYIVSDWPKTGYDVVRYYFVRRWWLPWKQQVLYLLHENTT